MARQGGKTIDSFKSLGNKSVGSWPVGLSDNTSYKPSGKNVFMQKRYKL